MPPCPPYYNKDLVTSVLLAASPAGAGYPTRWHTAPLKPRSPISLKYCITTLQAKGLGISAIHPGFVETPLTAPNEFTMPALITTDVAATEILAGWADGLFDIHFPKRFTWWLKLLRVLPHRWAQALIKKLTRL